MVILLTGASHTGKTALSQKLIEKYKYPCFSIDHLKMGLIRSKNTSLTPLDSQEKLTAYLWPIVREIIKTAIENNQNLIIEGCYIPFDWKNSFEPVYLAQICYRCLVMTDNYIDKHFEQIKKYADVIEKRIDDACTVEGLKADNKYFSDGVERYNLDYILIDENYDTDFEMW